MQPEDHNPLSLSKHVFTQICCFLFILSELLVNCVWFAEIENDFGFDRCHFKRLSLPGFKFPATNMESVLSGFRFFSQNLKLVRSFWSSFSGQTVVSLKISVVCVSPIKATKMTFRLWLIFWQVTGLKTTPA